MDVYCQRCDEPWDTYYVNFDMDEDSGPDEFDGDTKPSERFKRGDGCPACKWGKNAPKQKSIRGMAMGAMAELLGDDMDGMASMMDDFEYMGMLDEE
jgi:hypothetical protein